MNKALFLITVIFFLLGSSAVLYADPLTGSDAFFDSDGDLIAPIPGLEKLCNGQIHELKWKRKICYLSVEKDSGPGYYQYSLSLSREKNPDPEEFTGNYKKHITMGIDSRRELTHLDKSKVVAYETTSFQRYSLTFNFNPETGNLIKVVGKCGYRPFMPTVMTGGPVEVMKKAAFNELYPE